MSAVGLLGNRELRAALERGSERYGERFDTAGLAERFAPYYGTGQRIRVTTTYGKGRDAEVYTRTGTVGMTTGWRPSFLLIHRSSDSGSSDVLSDRAVVTHVQLKGKYVPVAEVARVQ